MIDMVVVGIYLLAMLSAGLWMSRGQSSVADYAVAGNSYGSLVIFATMSASFVGGAFSTGNAANVFLYGIAGVIGLWGFGIKEILIAIYVAPKITRFRSAISVGDILATSYGNVGRIVAGMSALFLCTAVVGAQVGAIGVVFRGFFGIPQLWGILIGCAIIIVYTTFGGMRAVVFTDVVQFILLSLGLPLILIFGIIHIGGVDALIAAVPAEHFAIPGAHYGWIGLIALMLTFMFGETLMPPYLQRLLAGRDLKSAARGTLYSGLYSIPLLTIPGFIGLVALAMDPTLDSNLALSHVVIEAMPPVLKGLVIAAVISIVMSSADSFLNSAGIAFINDIVQPLRSEPLADRAALRLARAVTFAVGALAVVFALTVEGIFDILIYAYTYWAPIIVVPLIATIYGVNRGVPAFFAGALAGAFVATFWDHMFAQPAQIAGLVIGMFANLAVFCLVPAPAAKQPQEISG
jgi:solute:Na+ symporter, SSS family